MQRQDLGLLKQFQVSVNNIRGKFDVPPEDISENDKKIWETVNRRLDRFLSYNLGAGQSEQQIIVDFRQALTGTIADIDKMKNPGHKEKLKSELMGVITEINKVFPSEAPMPSSPQIPTSSQASNPPSSPQLSQSSGFSLPKFFSSMFGNKEKNKKRQSVQEKKIAAQSHDFNVAVMGESNLSAGFIGIAKSFSKMDIGGVDVSFKLGQDIPQPTHAILHPALKNADIIILALNLSDSLVMENEKGKSVLEKYLDEADRFRRDHHVPIAVVNCNEYGILGENALERIRQLESTHGILYRDNLDFKSGYGIDNLLKEAAKKVFDVKGIDFEEKEQKEEQTERKHR